MDSTSGQRCLQGKTEALPTPPEVLSIWRSGYLFIYLFLSCTCSLWCQHDKPSTHIWLTAHYCYWGTEKRENFAVPWLHRSHWLVCLGQVRNLESVKSVRILKRKEHNKWPYSQISFLFIHYGLNILGILFLQELVGVRLIFKVQI